MKKKYIVCTKKGKKIESFRIKQTATESKRKLEKEYMCELFVKKIGDLNEK